MADVKQLSRGEELAHKNLAVKYFKQGLFIQAANEWKKALAIEPNEFSVRTTWR